MKDIKTFKIRCSAIGDIMGNLVGITDKQLIELDKLQSKEKLTDNQKEKLKELIYKRDTPTELSQTAKTYCEKWLKEHLYGKRKNISSKYFTKGNIVEQDSLDFIAEQLGLGMLLKNEERRSNEYLEGECDAIIPDLIIDAKNSWSHDTFPLFATKPPDENNVWQIRGYMELFDRPKGKVIYVLSDTPKHLIEKEAYWYCRDMGYDEMDDDILKKFYKNMTYSDVDDKLKIKVFSFDRNQEDIKKIKAQTIKCRAYIETLKKLI